MKISRWCSSSTSSRSWSQSASLSRGPCLFTTVLSHPHSRIAQGRCLKTCYSNKRFNNNLEVFEMFVSPDFNITIHNVVMFFIFLCVCLSCSPSVGYLQPPSSEQYQITQSPSPCNPPQLQQQYSGEAWCQQIVKMNIFRILWTSEICVTSIINTGLICFIIV